MHRQMPTINIDAIANLTDEERLIVLGIINLKTGELRASKPYRPHMVPVNGNYDYANEADALQGRRAYVWRMVAFFISPISQHHCMPIMAFCDLPTETSIRKPEEKRLDDLVKRIVDTVKIENLHGVRRWGKALGY